MTGTPFERESRRAQRRKERERQLHLDCGRHDRRPAAGNPGRVSPVDPLGGATVTPVESHGLTDEEVAELTEEAEDSTPLGVDDEEDASPESASQQVAALQHALHEKDELLSVLTAQLEEAADRLDRLHRAGIDRTSRVGVADMDAAAGSADVSEYLGRLTGQWEAAQFAEQFAAVRNRLDDIYDAVTLPRTAERSDGSRSVEEPMPRATDSASKLPGWEDMKAQLLRQGADQHRSDPNDEDATVADLNDAAADVLSDLPLEPPAAIDTDTADRDTLAAAVEERDVFISHLIRRLRSGSSGRYAPIDWAEVSGAPDDLRERLQEHEARLQELLRMEECDLSLERARLARERARLEQLRRDLERDPRDEDPDADEADKNERRWLRVFGFGRKPDGNQD
ncbi:MAG: hypothetical protein U0992_03820 [Planctomycetaceae bacterium]